MTVASSVTSIPGTTAVARPGVASRLVAGSLFAAAGLTVTAAVAGVAIAGAMLARGAVVLDGSDVALVRTIAPMATLLALLGIAHLVGAVGLVLGNRTIAAFAIGIGALDVVAGIVTLIAVALAGTDPAGAATFGIVGICAGIALAVAARAAEWGADPVEA